MALIPHRFLFRVAYPCRYFRNMPRNDEERLLDLPAECRLDNFAAMDDQRNFAEVAVAWNESGIGLEVEVKGKEELPQGDVTRPRGHSGRAHQPPRDALLPPVSFPGYRRRSRA